MSDVLIALMVFSILGLIFTFLLKLHNLLNSCGFYSIQESVIVLSVGTIAYVFIEIGSMVTFGSGADLVEFNLYFWFSRVFIILLWVFWFAELLVYAAKETIKASEDLTRMSKRRQERFKMFR